LKIGPLFLGGSTELDVERGMSDRHHIVPVDDDQMLRLTTFALPGDVTTVNNIAAILLAR